MNPRRLSEIRLRRLLPPVADELGKSNRDRLAAILPLFLDEGKARLADCIKAAFPGKNTAAAAKQFTNFQGDVNAAAAAAGVGLVFRSDNNKQHGPQARDCWFEGDDSAIEELTTFSREGISDLPKTEISNRGLATNWEDILAAAGQVRVFVSYARKDEREARELVELVRVYWRAGAQGRSQIPDPELIWVDWELSGGADWQKRIGEAMAESEVGLFLYSANAQASEFIQKVEWPHFRDAGKPVVPVRLGPIVESSPGYLEIRAQRQFVEHSSKDGSAARSYLDVRRRTNGNGRAYFATAILRGIADAIRQVRGAPVSHVDQTAPSPQEHRRLDDEFAGSLAGGKPDHHFEEGPALSTTLEKLERLDMAKDAPAGKVASAIQLIETWIGARAAPPFFAVLGEYGIGKTTTLKQLTRRLLDRRARGEDVPLPIFVDLRLYYASQADGHEVPTLEELLAEVVRRHWKGGGKPALTPAEIVDAVQNRGALIIFDGLDEKIVHYTPEQARQFIRELWRVLPPMAVEGGTPQSKGRRGRMIVSCRSHYFRDVVSQNSMLTAEARDGIRSGHYGVCIILPFTAEQIHHYLQAVLNSDKSARAAVALFDSVHNLAELARRPYLLSLMTGEIGELERRRARGEIVLGATLYDLLTLKWLARDDGKHHFTQAHKLAMMERLAADMFADSARAWPWRRIEEWLGRFLAERPDIAARYAKSPAEVLNEDFRTATFVLRPDDSREHFRFAHSSLQEFFHARHLVRALDEGAYERWAIQLPSMETLDFAGQLMALDDTAGRRAAFGKLLTQGEPLAARMALRSWLLAIDRGYPEPELDGKPAQLAGINLEKWPIRGRSAEQPLALGGASLAGAHLDGSRWEHVYLADADFSGASCAVTEFVDVNLTRGVLDGADFSGAIFRDCMAEGLRGERARWHEAEWSRSELRGAELGAEFERTAAMVTNDPGGKRPREPLSGLEMVVRSGHASTVTSCMWSPDGRRLASSGGDRTVRVWDVDARKCLRTLVGHEGWVSTCAWSPDGRWLASGGKDRTVRIWDAETGRGLRMFEGHVGGISACAWSPDGRLAAGLGDGTVRIWDVRTGNCLRVFEGHTGAVRACSWSPDGQRLVSGARDRTMRVWDAETGNCLATLVGHKGAVEACMWSPDGRWLASGADDWKVGVWDVELGKCLRMLAGHTGPVHACAWSPDGRRLISGAGDEAVRMWDVETGKNLRTLVGHDGWVRACAWSPDGRRLASGADDGKVEIWDAETGKRIRTFTGSESWVRACAWSPDGRRLASGTDYRKVRVWDVETGKCLRMLAGHTGSVRACAWSPDGQWLASGGDDRKVGIWDPMAGKSQHMLLGHEGAVTSCAWSPDGRWLASGSDDRKIRIWEAETGKSVHMFTGHEEGVTSCMWSPDGRRLASGGKDGTVQIWDTQTGGCLRTFGSKYPVHVVVWSPDGQRLATGGGEWRIRIWEIETGKCLRTLDVYDGPVEACMWSADGRWLVTGAGWKVRVWDAETGTCLHTLVGHEGMVTSCAWSPDGRRLASGASDRTVRIWDAESGKCQKLFAHFRDGESAALDLATNSFLWTSPGAWRHLGWRAFDPEAEGWGTFDREKNKWQPGERGRTRILPADFCGSLPAEAKYPHNHGRGTSLPRPAAPLRLGGESFVG